MNTKYFLWAFVLAALVPITALAAFNDVTIDTTTSNPEVAITDLGLNYVLEAATRVESITVNTGDVQFGMLEHSIVSLTSSNRSSFTLTGGCEVLARTCTASQSTIEVRCSDSATITITPGAANTCDQNGSGNTTSGSGGGGGAGPSTPTPAPVAPTVTPIQIVPLEAGATDEQSLSLNNPISVVVGSASHTFTLNGFDATHVTLTIESDPVVVTVEKDQTKDVDTNNDGIYDLRLAYLGLDASGDPQVKITELKRSGVCPLTVQNAYKSTGSSAVYYVTTECTKRAFKNTPIFFTYFTSWSEVQSTDASTLQSVAEDELGFMPQGPLYDPKYGALVKTVNDPKVYLLLGNDRYWITSEDVFNNLYDGQWNWIEDVDSRLLDKYGVGSEINYTNKHPNYTVIKYSGSSDVYRLEPDPSDATKQVKRHVPDETEFNKLGFRWDRIVTVDDIESYEDGEVLSSAGTGVQSVLGVRIDGTYIFTSLLSLGDSSDEVRQLQMKLKNDGYFSADTDITGYFGTMTEKAVKAFQTAHGIDPVGYVGPGTRSALNK